MEKKYYDLIISLIKNHKKYSGLESILNDIADDVYAKAEVVMQSIKDESVLENYFKKIVTSSIITVSRNLGTSPRKNESSINELLNSHLLQKETTPLIKEKAEENNDFAPIASTNVPQEDTEEFSTFLSNTEEKTELFDISNEYTESTSNELNTTEKVSVDMNLVDLMINGKKQETTINDEDTQLYNSLDNVSIEDYEPVIIESQHETLTLETESTLDINEYSREKNIEDDGVVSTSNEFEPFINESNSSFNECENETELEETTITDECIELDSFVEEDNSSFVECENETGLEETTISDEYIELDSFVEEDNSSFVECENEAGLEETTFTDECIELDSFVEEDNSSFVECENETGLDETTFTDECIELDSFVEEDNSSFVEYGIQTDLEANKNIQEDFEYNAINVEGEREREDYESTTSLENFNAEFEEPLIYEEFQISTSEEINTECYSPSNEDMLAIDTTDNYDDLNATLTEFDSYETIAHEELDINELTVADYEPDFIGPSARLEYFNYNPTSIVYDTESIFNKINKLDSENPKLQILQICNLKYNQRLSIVEIASILGITKEDVLNILNLVINEIKV